jgi:hypothetical protein
MEETEPWSSPYTHYRNARRAVVVQAASAGYGCADRDHWSAAGVDCLDYLGVVDALQVYGCDAEIAVAELALDDD